MILWVGGFSPDKYPRPTSTVGAEATDQQDDSAKNANIIGPDP